MKIRSLLVLLVTLLIGWEANAQSNENISLSGDARFAYLGSSSEPGDIFDGNSFLRVRVGGNYTFNENSSFTARLATTQSNDFPAVGFSIAPEGGGVNNGTITIDNFYYRYKNEEWDVKVGRFQYNSAVKSNAGRSIFRFQSNNVNNHWTDGFHAKKYLNEEWFGEVLGEYQNRGNTSYAYKSLLNFGNNKHNIAAYLGAQNQTRDENNFIQKGFGLFLAPDAFQPEPLQNPQKYSTYAGLLAQLVHDTPVESFQGGSFRIAAEAGQNVNADEFSDGTILNISFGVNNFAEQHELMIEFTKIGAEWQTANVYAPNADEMEIRYRYFFSKKFNIDFRYRIRDSRNDLIDINYNAFARATYKF